MAPIVGFGAWLVFMGAASLASLLLTAGKVGEVGQEFSGRLEKILRRMHALGPESFYRALVVPMSLLLMLAGAIMIVVGILK